MNRNPAWILHSHTARAGITDKQLAREFVCDLIGIRGRDTLKNLTIEQIQYADGILKKLSNEQIHAAFEAWKLQRQTWEISANELLALEEEFERDHAQALELGFTFTDFLESRGVTA